MTFEVLFGGIPRSRMQNISLAFLFALSNDAIVEL